MLPFIKSTFNINQKAMMTRSLHQDFWYKEKEDAFCCILLFI